MSKNNYNKMFNAAKEDEAPVMDVTSFDAEDVIAETAEPEIKIEDANDAEEATEVVGVVCNCAMLNVRKNPDIKSDVVTVISAGDEVIIDTELSTDDWYFVCNESGYCMKKYISVK